MQVFGKILGAFFGFLFGGPIGAALGLFIGHQFDKGRSINQAGGFGQAFGGGPRVNQEELQQEYFNAAFAVMGHVAKAKGNVTQQEIQLATQVMERMGLYGEQLRAAQNAFREGKESSFPLQETLQRIRSMISGRGDLLQFFLDLQISSAFADGELQASERELLFTIAKGLGFSAAHLESRLRMQEAAFRFQRGNGSFGGQQQSHRSEQSRGWQQASQASQLADAYEVLGVKASDDEKTIKRAYRKLMNEHHPDKLMAKGLPKEMMNVAKQKSQQIQNAYDVIKKEKDIR
ncbi:co-chaperone DjlA [Vibrio zhugei]|uniref:Co-chaperone protein DjlA n=1 Tax=Vibrio zhugei TaxID=2479546 RepID=A0ABV7CA72_9VIBR|nr:co-chaperone DjlA [Vibrio zhugei]